MMKRIDDLTPSEVIRAAPQVAAMRTRGIEPTHVFMPPYPSASHWARIARQDRRLAFKQAEVARRRGEA